MSALSNPSDDLYCALTGGERSTLSGVTVGPKTALTLSAYYAALRNVSDDIAKLPLILYRQLARGKERVPEHSVYRIIHDTPNGVVDSVVFWSTMIAHALGWGNGYAFIRRNNLGRAQSMELLTPDQVTPIFGKDRRLIYRINGAEIYDASFIFHLAGPGFDGVTGYSIAHMARESIALGLAEQNAGSSLFENGLRPSGILNSPRVLDQSGIDKTRGEWKKLYGGSKNTGKVAVLDPGWTYVPISVPNKDAQWIEGREFQVIEMCRWLRLPPHKMQVLAGATYNNMEQMARDYVSDTLLPWIRRIEQQIKSKLLTFSDERDLFAEFLIEGILRGDTAARNAAYALGRQWGWYSANDICEMENRNPLPGRQGDIYLVPMNMVPADRIYNTIDADAPDGQPEGSETDASDTPSDESIDGDVGRILGTMVDEITIRDRAPFVLSNVFQEAAERLGRVERDRKPRMKSEDAFWASHRMAAFRVLRTPVESVMRFVLLSDGNPIPENGAFSSVVERHSESVTDRYMSWARGDDAVAFDPESEVIFAIDAIDRALKENSDGTGKDGVA